MIRYAITEGDGPAPRGVEYVQLRAKALNGGELFARAKRLVADLDGGAQLLVNGRCDVAVATGAAGVHLTGSPEELSVAQVRRVFAASGGDRCVVSVSCHSVDEVRRASKAGADLILFGPVFEKIVGGKLVAGGVGLDLLRAACEAARGGSVLALGGVTSENISQCLAAGCGGVAGIRLFT